MSGQGFHLDPLGEECWFVWDKGWRICGRGVSGKRTVPQGESRLIKANPGGKWVRMGLRVRLGHRVGEFGADGAELASSTWLDRPADTPAVRSRASLQRAFPRSDGGAWERGNSEAIKVDQGGSRLCARPDRGSSPFAARSARNGCRRDAGNDGRDARAPHSAAVAKSGSGNFSEAIKVNQGLGV